MKEEAIAGEGERLTLTHSPWRCQRNHAGREPSWCQLDWVPDYAGGKMWLGELQERHSKQGSGNKLDKDPPRGGFLYLARYAVREALWARRVHQGALLLISTRRIRNAEETGCLRRESFR